MRLEIGVNHFHKKGIREEGQVSIVIVVFRCQIWLSRQCIGLDHLGPRNMYQFQIKLGQKETPLCLPVVQLLGGPEVSQVFVIREDGDRMLGAE